MLVAEWKGRIMGKCVHAIPGRARFRVPGIRDSETVARVMTRRLLAIDGVARVEIRRSSASVIVHYDPATTALATVSAVMAGEADHFHAPAPLLSQTQMPRRNRAAAPTSAPLLMSAARHIGTVASQTALKVMLERAVSTGVASLLRSTSLRM